MWTNTVFVAEKKFHGTVHDLKVAYGIPIFAAVVDNKDDCVKGNGEIIEISIGDELLVLWPLPC